MEVEINNDTGSDIKLEAESDDDEIPIGEENIETDKDLPADGAETTLDFPLGNSKKPGTEGKTEGYKKGNGNSGAPVAWMVTKVKMENFAHAHVGGISYGFDSNKNPVPGFHNHVLCIIIKDEDVDFFATKNAGEESLVDLVDHNGDVISIPTVTTKGQSIDKKATAVFFVTRYEQSTARLNALFSGFLGALNNAQWNGTTLNQRVLALTPEHFLTPIDGIGVLCWSARL